MRFLRTLGRFLVSVQLLPALEGGEETLVGGQAVLEGVMMRSPHAWAIACRKPSGEVLTHSEPLERLSEKHKWMGWPVVRGVITLGHAMTLGFRALKFSANVALDELQPEEPGKKKLEISGWMAAVNVLFSVGFFIFMYKFLPLLAATELKSSGEFRCCAISGGCMNTTAPSTRPSTRLKMAIHSRPPPCRNTPHIIHAAEQVF